MKLSDIFYEDQTSWTAVEFYQLTRNMNRLFYLKDKHKEEIDSLDLDRMSVMTKTIMAALTRDSIHMSLWDTPQFRELNTIKPLSQHYNLAPNPANGNKSFLYYNLGW